MTRIEQPRFDKATQEYCTPCHTKTPHAKYQAPTAAYETSTCLLCKPEILDAQPAHTFAFASFTRGETLRLARLREKWAGLQWR